MGNILDWMRGGRWMTSTKIKYLLYLQHHRPDDDDIRLGRVGSGYLGCSLFSFFVGSLHVGCCWGWETGFAGFFFRMVFFCGESLV